MKLLARSFYAHDTNIVARNLIGKILVRKIGKHILKGMIVETEAYRNDDPASHAFVGETKRNRALFGPAGHAYIYFSYGVHWCLNVVAHDKTHAGGVLIRALEPLQGIEIMQKNRKTHALKRLTSGPGNVTQALQIDASEYGMDVTKKNGLYIIDNKIDADLVVAVPRIGISKAKDLLLRFCLRDSPYLSVKIK